MEKIRFHCDEQVERAIAEALRRRGIDVTTTPEARLLGATDFDFDLGGTGTVGYAEPCRVYLKRAIASF